MITRTLLLLVATTLPPAMALAEDCNCSCVAFSQLENEIALFERQLDEGRIAMVTPTLQSHLQCMTPCAERWTQCPYTPATNPAIAQTRTGANDSTMSASALDSGDPKDW
jgi:hypothetical protein